MKPWESEKIFSGGREYYEALQDAIEQAKHSVDLEVYILKADAVGRSVLKCLEAACERGVQVRLLLDGFGSMEFEPSAVFQTPQPSFEIRLYRPVRRRFWKRAKKKHGGFTGFFRLLRYLNKRNHRKVCVIDGREMFAGSLNITEDHLLWKDVGVRVTGGNVGVLTTAFERTWKKAVPLGETRSWLKRIRNTLQTHKQQKLGSVRLNDSIALRRKSHRDLIQRVSKARKQVWVMNAYFIPSLMLLRILRLASWSGVDVRLILPRKSDVALVRWVSHWVYRYLMKGGVKIYEYLPSILHAKTIIIDSWAIVGSTNLNHRSWIHDLEVDVVLTHPSSVEKLRALYQADLKQAQNVTSKNLLKRGFIERVVGKLALIIRNWL